MFQSVVIVLASLVTQGPREKPPKDELAALAGEWMSPLLPIPGSRDGARQRTLEIGQKGKPDAVRQTWRDWCGQTSFAGDIDYVGRVVRVEGQGKKRVLVFAGEKDTEHRVEFEWADNELRLVGKIKTVDVGGYWKRKPVLKSNK
jgi:hypothetical protein